MQVNPSFHNNEIFNKNKNSSLISRLYINTHLLAFRKDLTSINLTIMTYNNEQARHNKVLVRD